MSIAQTVRMYLDQRKIPYELLTHSHSPNSLHTARRAHIEAGRLAKAVLLEEDGEQARFVMAVLPASRHLNLTEAARCAGRRVHLATEQDAEGLFRDCEKGAIPPLGPAYGVETIWEDGLADTIDLYLEAGDHETLVHVETRDFMKLMSGCAHGHITGRA